MDTPAPAPALTADIERRLAEIQARLDATSGSAWTADDHGLDNGNIAIRCDVSVSPGYDWHKTVARVGTRIEPNRRADAAFIAAAKTTDTPWLLDTVRALLAERDALSAQLAAALDRATAAEERVKVLETALLGHGAVFFLDTDNDHETRVIPHYPATFEVPEQEINDDHAREIIDAATQAGFKIGDYVWCDFDCQWGGDPCAGAIFHFTKVNVVMTNLLRAALSPPPQDAERWYAEYRAGVEGARAACDAAWPNGCHKPGTCGRHRCCMYMRLPPCRHASRDIGPEIDAANEGAPS